MRWSRCAVIWKTLAIVLALGVSGVSVAHEQETADELLKNMEELALSGHVTAHGAYIGEKGDFERLMGFKHFGCHTTVETIGAAFCSRETDAIVEHIGGFGGNRCGYSFFAIACHKP